jgi:hypothetical protein
MLPFVLWGSHSTHDLLLIDAGDVCYTCPGEYRLLPYHCVIHPGVLDSDTQKQALHPLNSLLPTCSQSANPASDVNMCNPTVTLSPLSAAATVNASEHNQRQCQPVAG